MAPSLSPFQTRAAEEDAFLLTQSAAPRITPIGAVHWRGVLTLTHKEIRRFLAMPFQTLVSPFLMTLLFFAVFSVSLGVHAQPVDGVPFLTFLAPGLIIMAMAQSAFFNTAGSLILSKIQGNLVDVLVAPLSPLELLSGYVLGGAARGLLVGVLSLAGVAFFQPLPFVFPLWILFFACAGVIMLSLIGLLTGILGDRFDHLGAVQNFLVMPATFLSGSFFPLRALPKEWALSCTLNPFFYMIDGFRYGFTGHSDAPVLSGAAFLVIVICVLTTISYWLFSDSRKIRP